MELIKPAEISGKIMTLIDDATDLIIIVSPYNKFSNWTKLTKRISESLERGVKIEWYIRKNVKDNYSEVTKLGIKPIEIENLHCKIYMNEKSAVVTSMNLLEYSDSNSIDIGYLIKNENDHKELLNFVDSYIRKVKNKTIIKKNSSILSESPNNLLDWIKLYYPKYSNSIIERGDDYNRCLEIVDFMGDFSLRFEQKYGYFRIDLRIGFTWDKRNKVYEKMISDLKYFQDNIGVEINAGSEIKRFKIDIIDLPSYNYKRWNQKEFELISPLIEKVFYVYENTLNKYS